MTRDPECLFCKIVDRQVPATIVRESDRTLAFEDIAPQAPVHVLVVPKDHHRNLAELAQAAPHTAAELAREAAAVAREAGIPAYRLVFNTGEAAGQSVFHVHGHVLGGRDLAWPPG